MSVWRGTGSGWAQVVTQTISGFGCYLDPLESQTFDLELINNRGQFNATVRGDGCGFTTVSWNNASAWNALYGERDPYPRYYLGAVGNPRASGFSIRLDSLYADRMTGSSGDDSCLGCF